MASPQPRLRPPHLRLHGGTLTKLLWLPASTPRPGYGHHPHTGPHAFVLPHWGWCPITGSRDQKWGTMHPHMGKGKAEGACVGAVPRFQASRRSPRSPSPRSRSPPARAQPKPWTGLRAREDHFGKLLEVLWINSSRSGRGLGAGPRPNLECREESKGPLGEDPYGGVADEEAVELTAAAAPAAKWIIPKPPPPPTMLSQPARPAQRPALQATAKIAPKTRPPAPRPA